MVTTCPTHTRTVRYTCTVHTRQFHYLVSEVHINTLLDQLPDHRHSPLPSCHHEGCLLRFLHGIQGQCMYSHAMAWLHSTYFQATNVILRSTLTEFCRLNILISQCFCILQSEMIETKLVLANITECLRTGLSVNFAMCNKIMWLTYTYIDRHTQ